MNLEHQGITKREVRKGNVGVARNDAKFLTSFDHQLIIHVMYGLDNVIISKREERRIGKKATGISSRTIAAAVVVVLLLLVVV
jgi:hypothetical protein